MNRIFMRILFFVIGFLIGFVLTHSLVNAALVDNITTYYKMDTNSGSTLVDSVSSNDGTISGALWTAGKINSGLFFDGINDQVTTYTTAQEDPFTWNVWVNKNTSTGVRLAMAQDTGGPDNAIGVSGNNVFFRVRGGTAYTGMALPLGEWVMMTLTYDGSGNARAYVNGSLVASVTVGAQTGNHLIYIGSRNVDNFWVGNLDEVGIWTRALTADEISDLYNNNEGLQYPFELAELTFSNYTINNEEFLNLSHHPFSSNNFSITISNSSTNLASINATYFLYNSTGALIETTQFLTNGGSNFTNFSTTGKFQLNLSDGDYAININATNNETSTETGIYNFTIDTIEPQINIFNTSPINSYNVVWSNHFNYSDTNPATCVITAELVNVSCDDPYTFTTNGNQNLFIYVNDTAGNIGTANFTLLVDPFQTFRFFDTNTSAFITSYQVEINGETYSDTDGNITESLFTLIDTYGNYTITFIKSGYPRDIFNLTFNSTSEYNITFNTSPLQFQLRFFYRTNYAVFNKTVDFTIFDLFNASTSSGVYALDASNFTADNYTIQARSTGYYTETQTFEFTGLQNQQIDIYLLETDSNNSATLFIQISDEFFNIIEGADTRLLEYDPDLLAFKQVSQCVSNSNGECEFLVEVGTKTYIITTQKIIGGILYTAQSSEGGEVFQPSVSGGEEVLGEDIIRSLVLTLSDSLEVPRLFGVSISAPTTAQETIVSENETETVVYIPISFINSLGTNIQVCLKWQVLQGTRYSDYVADNCLTASSGIIPTSNITLDPDFTYKAVITVQQGNAEVIFREYIYPSSQSLYSLFFSDGLAHPALLFLWVLVLTIFVYSRSVAVWFYMSSALALGQAVIFPSLVFGVTTVLIILINWGVLYASKKQLDTT